MPKFNSPLENIQIASPCSADWEQMYGDERKRFCGDCKLNVYNLSGMTRSEAETLVASAEGRLCVRYFKRADGSIITADCPVGWAKVRARTRSLVVATASLVLALFTGVFFSSLFGRKEALTGKLLGPVPTPSPTKMMGAISRDPQPTPTPKATPVPQAVMGDVAIIKPGSSNIDPAKLRKLLAEDQPSS